MAANARGRGPKRANGAREAEILGLLQDAREALTPGEVTERLGDELTYSSVVTILTRMHTKQLLTRTPRGRAYAYAPVTDGPGFAARRMRTVLEERPDREAVLARFADGLSATDADLLRQLLGGEDGGAEQDRGAARDAGAVRNDGALRDGGEDGAGAVRDGSREDGGGAVRDGSREDGGGAVRDAGVRPSTRPERDDDR
ncbi:BlaI/MecI/CopY family transcriptional regulator [Streptomyces sp. TS71-3]|uniref:BlaI/MecI/CopY family transcriptional regulator n=1 Tax=Streptomyces sp. TS71-3 TaxID=2733862 RepID=UPI001B0F857E|nr:BlaI/MecI/CopY family transcriptional regulator [Streptomyces sp. TS71-3]GHJ40446.1 hypothetical protein Sm713_60550 [Streptomyces sp. TS71-3]